MHWLLRAGFSRVAVTCTTWLLLAAGMAGCSLAEAPSNSGSGTPTAQSTQPPKLLVITTDRRQYSQSEVIGVTVQNLTSTPYYAIEQFSACTMLVMQFRVNGNWQEVQPCVGGPEPPVRQLAPKVTFPLSFGPGNTPNNPNLWQPGTYRFVLEYSGKADASGAQSFSYSASFVIGD
jgi:hypothetical protein